MVKRIVRKTLVALIGFPVVALGLLLIPLPGPGLLVVFIGFLILSLEFEWAEKHLEGVRKKLKEFINRKFESIDKRGR